MVRENTKPNGPCTWALRPLLLSAQWAAFHRWHVGDRFLGSPSASVLRSAVIIDCGFDGIGLSGVFQPGERIGDNWRGPHPGRTRSLGRLWRWCGHGAGDEAVNQARTDLAVIAEGADEHGEIDNTHHPIVIHIRRAIRATAAVRANERGKVRGVHMKVTVEVPGAGLGCL